MIRLVGCILIILSGVGFGAYFAGKAAGRVKILEELQRDLQFLYGEIEYSACNMPELFEQVAAKEGMLAPFWSGLVEKMRRRSGMTFSELWRCQISELPQEISISEDGKRLLAELGDNLGNLERKTQLHTISLFQKRLIPMLNRGWDEYRGQAKVCYALGLSGGLFLCIVLF